jgi:hypothetical protein
MINLRQKSGNPAQLDMMEAIRRVHSRLADIEFRFPKTSNPSPPMDLSA